MRRRYLARPWLLLGAALLVGVLLAGVAMAQTSKPSAKPALKQFKMVRSQSAAAVKGGKCLKGAYANVRVTDAGQGNQNLYITLNKAAKNTEFTVFVIQEPNSPFGVSWYQGDIATDNKGHGAFHRDLQRRGVRHLPGRRETAEGGQPRYQEGREVRPGAYLPSGGVVRRPEGCRQGGLLEDSHAV
jgi:hypothetical protein